MLEAFDVFTVFQHARSAHRVYFALWFKLSVSFCLRLKVMQCTVLLWEFCLSVRPSVCLSVIRVSALGQNEVTCQHMNTIRKMNLCSFFGLQQRLLGLIALHLKYWLKLAHPVCTCRCALPIWIFPTSTTASSCSFTDNRSCQTLSQD